MAKSVKKSNLKGVKKIPSPFFIFWKKHNYFLLLIGIFLLIIGLFIMSIGDWDSTTSLIISPIILFIAYFIIFPLAIFYKKNKSLDNLNNSK